jgi:hypothetical protein
MTWPIGGLQSRRATGAHGKALPFVLNRASMAATPLVSGILPDGECGRVWASAAGAALVMKRPDGLLTVRARGLEL